MIDESVQCAECGNQGADLLYKFHTFQYGIDADHVMLNCKLPVYHCLDDKCKFAWYNYTGEEAIQAAIDKYLAKKNNN